MHGQKNIKICSSICKNKHTCHTCGKIVLAEFSLVMPCLTVLVVGQFYYEVSAINIQSLLFQYIDFL